MIEYKFIDHRYWQELNISLYSTCHNFKFEDYQVRINGVVYSRNTDEFVKAYEQEELWQKLQTS